jgi:UDP-glucose 4-epimerase
MGEAMTWLITGGAGYIGAHVVTAFEAAGLETVVVDSLASGHADFVPGDVPLVLGDIRDTDLLRRAMRERRVEGVVHLAAFKYAGVSVDQPLHTYQQNVVGTASLLEAMEKEGAGALVFSSSSAVYGTPEVDVVDESTPVRPESPYGESKLVGEWLVRDQARVTGLRHTSLRYFNVVGSGVPSVMDTSPHNLFPLVLDALEAGRAPRIFGDDYPTADGTCVRDYVHVADIAASHVAAAVSLASGAPLDSVYNLGSGTGASVRQIMDAFAQVTGIEFEPEIAPRRPGDPAWIISSGETAARDLGWTMRYSLTQMVESACSARRSLVRDPR